MPIRCSLLASRHRSSVPIHPLDRPKMECLYPGANLGQVSHDDDADSIRPDVFLRHSSKIRAGHRHDLRDVAPVVLQRESEYQEPTQLAGQIARRLELTRELQGDKRFRALQLISRNDAVPNAAELPEELDQGTVGHVGPNRCPSEEGPGKWPVREG